MTPDVHLPPSPCAFQVRICLGEELVEGADIVLSDLNGLELAELAVIVVARQEVSEAVEGGVELAHPLTLSVVGVHPLLTLLLRSQLLWTRPTFSRGCRLSTC